MFNTCMTSKSLWFKLYSAKMPWVKEKKLKAITGNEPVTSSSRIQFGSVCQIITIQINTFACAICPFPNTSYVPGYRLFT